jgi:rsbT antagonist protein RsbS
MERIPILRMGKCLLVTIQVDMQDKLVMALQGDLAQAVAAKSTTGLLIDISALEMVDSFIGRMIANTAAIGRILDVETVVARRSPSRSWSSASRFPASTPRSTWSGAWHCWSAQWA